MEEKELELSSSELFVKFRSFLKPFEEHLSSLAERTLSASELRAQLIMLGYWGWGVNLAQQGEPCLILQLTISYFATKRCCNGSFCR